MRYFFVVVFYLTSRFCFGSYNLTSNYSFIVAGHAYGGHYFKNVGLYPKFLTALESKDVPSHDFIVFTGDAIRHGTSEGFKTLERDLKKQYFLTMGNHENSKYGREFFKKKYKSDYYSFTYGKEKFIFLNSQKSELSISENQVLFLKKTLGSLRGIKTAFIFFHELLWNDNIRYQNIKSNKRCRYNNIKGKSNFWSEIFPILENYNDINFYIIAGDVGGNIDAIPAYYEKNNNIELLASGMGEVLDENFLYIQINNGKISKKLFLLDNLKEVPIEKYNIEFLKKTHIATPNFEVKLFHFYKNMFMILTSKKFYLVFLIGVFITLIIKFFFKKL